MDLASFKYQVALLLNEYDKEVQDEIKKRIELTLGVLRVEIISMESVAIIIANVLFEKFWKDRDAENKYTN